MIMNHFLRISFIGLLILTNFYFYFSQEKSLSKESFEKGKTEAQRNIKIAKYVFKVWGLDSSGIYPWQTAEEIYHSILKNEYKIAFERIGGCMVDEKTAEYADSYNEVIKAGVEAKFGTGILEKIRKQAEAEYESKYGEKQREFDEKFEEGLKSLKPLPKGIKFSELIEPGH